MKRLQVCFIREPAVRRARQQLQWGAIEHLLGSSAGVTHVWCVGVRTVVLGVRAAHTAARVRMALGRPRRCPHTALRAPHVTERHHWRGEQT